MRIVACILLAALLAGLPCMCLAHVRVSPEDAISALEQCGPSMHKDMDSAASLMEPAFSLSAYRVAATCPAPADAAAASLWPRPLERPPSA